MDKIVEIDNPTNFPLDERDVMVTYNTGTLITKRGFYSKIFNHIAIPPGYQYFNGVLLPHGWGGERLKLNQVISWKEIE